MALRTVSDRVRSISVMTESERPERVTACSREREVEPRRITETHELDQP